MSFYSVRFCGNRNVELMSRSRGRQLQGIVSALLALMLVMIRRCASVFTFVHVKRVAVI